MTTGYMDSIKTFVPACDNMAADLADLRDAMDLASKPDLPLDKVRPSRLGIQNRADKALLSLKIVEAVVKSVKEL